MSLERVVNTMLTNDVPQCDDVVQARGWQAEGSRLQAASAVVKEMEGFDDMPPDSTARVGGAFGLGTVGGEQSLRARAADAVEAGGVGQCGFLMAAVVCGQNSRRRQLFRRLLSERGVALPAVVDRQPYCRQQQ